MSWRVGQDAPDCWFKFCSNAAIESAVGQDISVVLHSGPGESTVVMRYGEMFREVQRDIVARFEGERPVAERVAQRGRVAAESPSLTQA